MSNESFKTFLAKVQHDENLRNELRAAGGEAGMPIDAVVAFAAGKGYEFKVEDISGELTDANLDNVAGGGAQPHMIGLNNAFLKIEGLNNTFLKLDGLNNAFLKIDGGSTYLSLPER